MNEAEERMKLKKDKARTVGGSETESSNVRPKECEGPIPTTSSYGILLENLVDDGTEPRKTPTENCIMDTSDNIRNPEDELDLSLELTENVLPNKHPTETQRNESTHIDEMESTQIEVNFVGEAEMGDNVLCDEEQEKMMMR